MSFEALGIVEVAGMIASIETADSMAKAADVEVVAAHKVDGLRICVICKGDVAACKAAVDSAVAIATSKGTLLGHNVIPNSAEGTPALLKHLSDIGKRKQARKAAKNKMEIKKPVEKAVPKAGKK